MAIKLKIKKGDEVVVISGKYKGKKGKVIKVRPENSRVTVAGVAMVKHHKKAGAGGAGGIIESESSIHISNVSHVDPKSGDATKIGFKNLKDGKKVRFAKKSKEVIDN